MSEETVEGFRVLKEHDRQERAEQLAENTARLKRLEARGWVGLEWFNEGLHARVTAVQAGTFDFWPSTGRWRSRNGKVTGYGWAGLMAELQLDSRTWAEE